MNSAGPRARTLLILTALAIAGCAANQLASKAPIAEPDVTIDQLSSVAPAARNMTGGITVDYQVTVHNNANIPITIKRVDVNSIGAGAYDLDPTSKPFDLTIAAGGTSSVEFWAAGVASQTILGANGPVTVRVVVLFDSPAGQFQTVATEQVHSRIRG